MKLGITGATGHIGNNLLRRLQKEHHELRLFIHRDTGSVEGVEGELFRGDLLRKEDAHSFVKGLDAVFHLAARVFINGKKRWQYFHENMLISDNMLDAVKEEGCRYVYFSSVHAYDPRPGDEPLDETRRLVTGDRFLYSRSKALSQQKVLQAAAEGLDALVLNPSAVIGPHDYRPSLLGKAIMMMADRKLPALIPGGYDWVDVRDVAEGALSALKKGRAGEAYLLTGHWKSMEGLNDIVRGIEGIRRKPPLVPVWVARAGVPFMGLVSLLKGEPPRYTQESITILLEGNRRISHEKASRELGYRPRPLKDTLEDTIRWFREEGMIK